MSLPEPFLKLQETLKQLGDTDESSSNDSSPSPPENRKTSPVSCQSSSCGWSSSMKFTNESSAIPDTLPLASKVAQTCSRTSRGLPMTEITDGPQAFKKFGWIRKRTTEMDDQPFSQPSPKPLRQPEFKKAKETKNIPSNSQLSTLKLAAQIATEKYQRNVENEDETKAGTAVYVLYLPKYSHGKGKWFHVVDLVRGSDTPGDTAFDVLSNYLDSKRYMWKVLTPAEAIQPHNIDDF